MKNRVLSLLTALTLIISMTGAVPAAADTNSGASENEPASVTRDAVSSSSEPASVTDGNLSAAPAWQDGSLQAALPSEDASLSAGIYTIVPSSDTSRALGIADASTEGGAALQVQDASGGVSQRFAVTPLGGGLYSIISYASGLSLDIIGGGTANGTRIQQYRRNRTAAQQFYIRRGIAGCVIVPRVSGLAFDLPGASTAAGTYVQTYDYNGTAAQMFSFNAASAAPLSSGTYIIHTSYADSKVLDVAGASVSSGGNLQIYEENGSEAQQFTLTVLSDGSFLISPLCSSLAFDVAGGSGASGANVQQYAFNNSAAQRWSAQPTADGYYTLIPACASGHCLDIAGASSENGANAQLWESNQSSAQKFSFEMTDAGRTLPDGAFMISSTLASDKVLDIAGASTEDGGNLQIYAANASNAQKFVMSYLGGGYYNVICACSGKVLDVAGGSSASGANVRQYTANSSAGQKWRFISKGNGRCTVVSALGTVLDVAGASSASGTNVQAYAGNGSDAQQFSVIPTTAVIYTPPVKKSYLIAIDAGHQLHSNTGTEPIGPGSTTMKQKVASGTYGEWSGLNEYQLNLDVALKLRDELKKRGYDIFMIRTTNDVNISNAERAQMATAAGADILVRIHGNSVDSSSVSGALCYQPSSSNPYLSSSVIKGSQRLSQCLVNGECAATGLRNRGLLDGDDMTGINWATMPVTIVEMGFMSNQHDDLYMASASGQAAIVQGIANGIDQYFG